MSNSQSSTMAESSSSSSPSASSPRLHNVDLEKQASKLHLDSKPSLDVNLPFSTENEEQAVFPEEYNIETKTGLVPVATLRSLRNATSERKTIVGTKQQEIEYVTFMIDDPDNPMVSCRLTMLVSVLVIAVAFGSSNVTSGLALIEDRYNVSLEVAILTCSIMVAGFALEQYGRRPIDYIPLLLYTIFNIPCALAPNIGGLLVCRFLCGIFASSGLVLAGGTIADIWDIEHRGNAIAYFAAAPYCGPVFWRLDLIFWVNMAFAGVICILILLFPRRELPTEEFSVLFIANLLEYVPVLLKRRAKKLRKATGNPNIMTEQEYLKLPFAEIVRSVLIRPVYLILTEPILDLMNSYIILIYALLYAFFFAYPVIFGKLCNYNDAIIGLMLLSTHNSHHREILPQNLRPQKPTPEDRLICAMIGAPFVPISLFILGATSFKYIIWVGPASAGLAFGYGMALIYFCLNNYIIDSYEKCAAVALAAKVFPRPAGGAAFSLFTMQMYDRLGLQWASWLLAFISLVMVVIPFTNHFSSNSLRSRASDEIGNY
ncbi:major facilitator superfamily domain-containing protein [Lipomyces starkeyi]|uniref:Major facilitator superfamily (MFS) profile domain-containing protein n=1 Tax=Lipomyces starkeyi NRRL Y-11557 TaxID=675824 RepID=A0A1E3Q0X8_LIPST|nr:hypothetical protein LIPSTDRAFT_119428 [Lipomyces starkeyi NRRL Y-11557]